MHQARHLRCLHSAGQFIYRFRGGVSFDLIEQAQGRKIHLLHLRQQVCPTIILHYLTFLFF